MSLRREWPHPVPDLCGSAVTNNGKELLTSGLRAAGNVRHMRMPFGCAITGFTATEDGCWWKAAGSSFAGAVVMPPPFPILPFCQERLTSVWLPDSVCTHEDASNITILSLLAYRSFVLSLREPGAAVAHQQPSPG